MTNDGLVTDHVYVNNTLASPLVPEEALGAFIGENPNGTWTLTVSDDEADDAAHRQLVDHDPPRSVLAGGDLDHPAARGGLHPQPGGAGRLRVRARHQHRQLRGDRTGRGADRDRELYGRHSFTVTATNTGGVVTSVTHYYTVSPTPQRRRRRRRRPRRPPCATVDT